MSMNIKNPKTHKLAKELADITGESVTEAVTVAVEERLQRLKRRDPDALASRLMAIGRHAAAHMEEPYKSMDIDEFLYDERGLPK
jgi:antitoxin VapB